MEAYSESRAATHRCKPAKYHIGVCDANVRVTPGISRTGRLVLSSMIIPLYNK